MKSEVTNMSIQVFAFIVALALMLGCSDETLKPEDEIKAGDIVIPPHGCVDLRIRGGEC